MNDRTHQYTRKKTIHSSRLMRRYCPDVFHCQSQRVHKFLSQHDDGIIVITIGDPGRSPTVSGASCKRRVVIQFPLRGFLRGGSSFSYCRGREFSRVFATYLAYDLSSSFPSPVSSAFVESPVRKAGGCLMSFHEKLANARVLSSGL